MELLPPSASRLPAPVFSELWRRSSLQMSESGIFLSARPCRRSSGETFALTFPAYRLQTGLSPPAERAEPPSAAGGSRPDISLREQRRQNPLLRMAPLPIKKEGIFRAVMLHSKTAGSFPFYKYLPLLHSNSNLSSSCYLKTPK